MIERYRDSQMFVSFIFRKLSIFMRLETESYENIPNPVGCAFLSLFFGTAAATSNLNNRAFWLSADFQPVPSHFPSTVNLVALCLDCTKTLYFILCCIFLFFICLYVWVPGGIKLDLHGNFTTGWSWSMLDPIKFWRWSGSASTIFFSNWELLLCFGINLQRCLMLESKKKKKNVLTNYDEISNSLMPPLRRFCCLVNYLLLQIGVVRS